MMLSPTVEFISTPVVTALIGDWALVPGVRVALLLKLLRPDLYQSKALPISCRWHPLMSAESLRVIVIMADAAGRSWTDFESMLHLTERDGVSTLPIATFATRPIPIDCW